MRAWEQSRVSNSSFLFRSKLQVEDMREIHLVNKDATWKGDKDVTSCKLCEKPFSVARRKVGNNIWAVTCDFQQCGMLTYIYSDEPVGSFLLSLENPSYIQSVAFHS